MNFIYDAAYKLISRKCPDSLESRPAKSKHHGNDGQIRKKMTARNETGKVCIFIIILIIDSRMVFN